jgi:hypothetical protein
MFLANGFRSQLSAWHLGWCVNLKLNLSICKHLQELLCPLRSNVHQRDPGNHQSVGLFPSVWRHDACRLVSLNVQRCVKQPWLKDWFKKSNSTPKTLSPAYNMLWRLQSLTVTDGMWRHVFSYGILLLEFCIATYAFFLVLLCALAKVCS